RAGRAFGPLGASRAGAGNRLRPAIVFVEQLKAVAQDSRTSIDPIRRQLPEPRFPSLAHGAAEYQPGSLKIDGDLSDWGELRHALPMRWNKQDERIEDGVKLYLRWNTRGLYFAYRVHGRTDPDIPGGKPYEGDVLEVFIDVDNLRHERMIENPNTQQFCLMPFGNEQDRHTTFAEVGRGFRGIMRHSYRYDSATDPNQCLGIARGRVHDNDNHYTVEAFISRRALAQPKLDMKKGGYIAMNFSVNRGFDASKSQQWSLSKAHETYNRPNTWGDVLLLGTDAEVRFVDAEQPDKAPIAPTSGQPLGVAITDPDMNADPDARDRILCQVGMAGSVNRMYVVLAETGPQTGVFRGSFDTQVWGLPPRPNTLSVRPGHEVHAHYKDASNRYGESDREVKARLQIGVPVFRLSRLQ
ncbi:MAG: hypothetical protein KGY81_08500, partial [Phycisphaerae bacterium]|nr:hypothetical protein [Phycisphaerae bacterium]